MFGFNEFSRAQRAVDIEERLLTDLRRDEISFALAPGLRLCDGSMAAVAQLDVRKAAELLQVIITHARMQAGGVARLMVRTWVAESGGVYTLRTNADYLTFSSFGITMQAFVAMRMNFRIDLGFDMDDDETPQMREAFADHFLVQPDVAPLVASLEEQAANEVERLILKRFSEMGQHAVVSLFHAMAS